MIGGEENNSRIPCRTLVDWTETRVICFLVLFFFCGGEAELSLSLTILLEVLNPIICFLRTI